MKGKPNVGRDAAWRPLVALLMLALISCSRARAPSNESIVKIPVPGAEVAARSRGAPSSFEGPNAFSVHDGRVYILDAVNHRMVVLDAASGQAIGRIRYPDKHYFTAMAYDGKHFHMINNSLQRYVVLNRSGKIVLDEIRPADVLIGPDAAQTLMRSAAAKAGETVEAEQIRLTSAEQWGALTVSVGEQEQFAIESCYLLAGADVVAVNTSGYYFNVVELLDGYDVNVEQSVRWYGPDGRLQGIYAVPFKEYFVFPNNDLAYDEKTGALYNMIVRESGLEVRRVEWTEPSEYVGRFEAEFGETCATGP